MRDLGPVWQAESKPAHASLDLPLDKNLPLDAA